MFGIGWDVLQPKGNIIAPIVFIPAQKKTPKMRGSFAMQATRVSIHVEGDPCIYTLLNGEKKEINKVFTLPTGLSFTETWPFTTEARQFGTKALAAVSCHPVTEP